MGKRQRRDRGFSLVIVFLLMIVMTGTAIGVLLASQTDLNLAGVTREQQMALYAAEYAVARAKSLLGSQQIPLYNATTGWTPLLTSALPAIQAGLCQTVGQPTAQPSVVFKNVDQLFYTLPDKSGDTTQNLGRDVMWNYCIHNNAEDPGYLDPSVAGVYDGHTNDARDPQHLIVIEAVGTAPNNARVQLTVTVGTPTLNSLGGTTSYAQEGAGGVHTGEGGSSEAGITVTTGIQGKF